MSRRRSWRACAGPSCSESTPLRLSRTRRWAPVASYGVADLRGEGLQAVRRRPDIGGQRRGVDEAPVARLLPGRDVEAQCAQVGPQVRCRLLEGHEDPRLPTAHALGQELAGEDGLGAARLAGDDGCPTGREPARGYLVEAGDASGDLGDRGAQFVAVPAQVEQAVPAQVEQYVPATVEPAVAASLTRRRRPAGARVHASLPLLCSGRAAASSRTLATAPRGSRNHAVLPPSGCGSRADTSAKAATRPRPQPPSRGS